MKINWKYIQVFGLIVLVIFLYGFSEKRNSKRKLNKISIEYTNGQNLFITKKTVNNLLITKRTHLEKQSKDSLNLNVIEKKLNHHPMIANAEVFETITGELGVIITQRKPLARVIGKTSFYIDNEGVKMPLSKNYSARKLLVSGIDTTDIATLFPLLKKIEGDEFLSKHITAVVQKGTDNYILRLRGSSLTVVFGRISKIDQKIKNFKAFYKKAYITKKLEKYSKVNLKFANQVVCTKKEA